MSCLLTKSYPKDSGVFKIDPILLASNCQPAREVHCYCQLLFRKIWSISRGRRGTVSDYVQYLTTCYSLEREYAVW